MPPSYSDIIDCFRIESKIFIAAIILPTVHCIGYYLQLSWSWTRTFTLSPPGISFKFRIVIILQEKKKLAAKDNNVQDIFRCRKKLKICVTRHVFLAQIWTQSSRNSYIYSFFVSVLLFFFSNREFPLRLLEKNWKNGATNCFGWIALFLFGKCTFCHPTRGFS